MRQGTMCLISSGLAKSNISEALNNITIKTNKSIFEVVTDCVDVLTCLCMFYKGETDYNTGKSQTLYSQNLCLNVHLIENCILEEGKIEDCLEDPIKRNIFDFIFFPFKNKLFPKKSDVESIKDKLVSWFVINKYLAYKNLTLPNPGKIITFVPDQDSVNIKFNFETEGPDIKILGENSGVENEYVLFIKITNFVAFFIIFLRII